MLQVDRYYNDSEMTKEDYMLRELLFCDGMSYIDGNIWVSSLELNMLICIERSSGRIQSIKQISPNRNGLIPYRYLYSMGNILFLLPYDDNNLCIYNLEKDEIEMIAIPDGFFMKERRGKITGAIWGNGELILYGQHSKILIFDVKSREFKWIELKEENNDMCVRGGWNIGAACHKEGLVMFVTKYNPHIIKMDSDYGIICEAIIGETCESIENTCFSGDYLYYTTNNRNVQIKKYDLKKREISIVFEKSTKGDTYRYFGCIFSSNRNIIALAGQGENTIRIRKDGFRVLQKYKSEKYYKFGETYPYEFFYRNAILTEYNNIITINPWERKLIEVNLETDKIIEKKISLEMKYDQIMIKKIRTKWLSEVIKTILPEIVHEDSYDNMLVAYIGAIE